MTEDITTANIVPFGIAIEANINQYNEQCKFQEMIRSDFI